MTSVLVEKLSRAFVADHNDNLIAACKDIASEIQSGRSKIHYVVEQLETFLTNEDIALRSNGVKALSLVLKFLPGDYLDDKELELLTAFYCDRLKDHHSVGPNTVLGVLALIKMRNIPCDAPAKLLHRIFENIRCQSELRETRRNIYLILQAIIQNHLDDVISMGPDFVCGLITTMESECDPRNLMLLFDILPLFLKKFPLGHLTEEMFDVLACYFPIDFNVSASVDKKAITREDLAEALAPCLCAIPEFAPFCLPQLIEKIDSDRKVAKLDSLSLLAKGAAIFGTKGLENHLETLWPLLKREAMIVNDGEIKKLALSAISEIVKAIADDERVRKSFVEKIFTEIRWSLSDVQLRLYWPAERLLESIARTERKSSVQVLLEVVPLCLGQYCTKTSINDKITLMETLNNFIKISLDLDLSIVDIRELAWTDIPGLYLKELENQDDALKTKALTGLIIQKSSLKDGQKKNLYEKVCDMIDSEISSDLRNACNGTLLAFAKLNPNEIMDILEKRLDIVDDNASVRVLSRRFETIAILTKILEIGMAILPKIVDVATSKIRPEVVVAIAINCLYRILASPKIDYDIHGYLYSRCDAIDRLMSRRYSSGKTLNVVSCVLRSIVRKLNHEEQEKIVDSYVIVDAKKLEESDVVLYEGIITPLRPTVKIPNLENLTLSLYKYAKDNEFTVSNRSACRTIAVLVNKLNDKDESHQKIVNDMRQRVDDILKSDVSSIAMKKFAINLHTWITKALLTRGSADSQNFLDYQMNMLRLESVGGCAAEEFKTLVDKSENSLTDENFCTIKMFYKQRIFENVIRSNGTFDAGDRQNYLVALALLVDQVPIEMPFMHLQALVPLLIESLSLDDGSLLLATLKTLKLLLETKHEIFIDQIQSFITKCMHLVTYKKMNVRIAALHCLSSYCKYPTVELIKFKQDVLDKLLEPLDDDKRLVRRMAVEARTRWYLVGANGAADQ